MVNHDVLCMPVHRAMATLALLTMRLLLEEEEEKRKEPAHAHIAVLGAGGCAMPSYLYKKYTTSKQSCVIDAVEPNIEVLGLAERFFGVRFATEGGKKGIVPHAMKGEQYMKDTNKKPLDVLLIDTCTNELEKTLAPVSSMLDLEFWKNVSIRMKQDGMVVVNVLGGDEHEKKLLSSIKQLLNFSIPMELKIKGSNNLVYVMLKKCEGGNEDDSDNKVKNLVELLELAGGIEHIIRR